MSIFNNYAPDISDIYDAYADMLFRIALSHLQNTHDAEDAVHEVFLRFFKSSVSFRDENHLKAWLIRVTVNLCHDMTRRHKVRSFVPIDEAANLPSDSNSEDRELVRELLNELSLVPEKYRTVIVLYYLEGFSVEEAARSLGISVSAAKMRLSRGRQYLKEQLLGGE